MGVARWHDRVMAIPLDTFAERAWFAYLCKRAGGKLAYKTLETKSEKGDPPDGLPPKATFSKLFKGDRAEPREAARIAIARVLGVEREWLELGKGAAPVLTVPYVPMPKNEEHDEHDPTEWVRKYKALESVSAKFQAAVMQLGSSIDADVIERVAAEARQRETDLETLGWMARLIDEQQKKAAAAAPAPKKRQKALAAPARKVG